MHHCNQHRLRHIRIWCVNICFYCIAEIANPLGMCSNWRELFLCLRESRVHMQRESWLKFTRVFIEHKFLKLHFCTCRGQKAVVWLRRGEERGKLVSEWCVSKHRRVFIASLVRERSKKAVQLSQSVRETQSLLCNLFAVVICDLWFVEITTEFCEIT